MALDVVIVSFRSRELLRECLHSLRERPPLRPLRVFVVDNASGDGTVELVRGEFAWVDLVAAPRNLGFAAASNLAIRRGDGEYVLALNPDTRVLDGSLDRLLELMDARPEIGVCGCRLLRPDGSLDHAARRAFPTLLGTIGHFSGLGRGERAPRALAQYRLPWVESGPVDAVNGAFMLMRRRALDEVGLFDEGYWMYFEDLDLCYRFHQAGWVVWYEPSATVVHVKHGSSGDFRSARLNVAFHYGMFRFWRKHYARRRHVLVNLLAYAGLGAKLLGSLVRSGVARRLEARAR